MITAATATTTVVRKVTQKHSSRKNLRLTPDRYLGRKSIQVTDSKITSSLVQSMFLSVRGPSYVCGIQNHRANTCLITIFVEVTIK